MAPEALPGPSQAGISRIMQTQADLPEPHQAHLALNRWQLSAPKATQTGYFLGPVGPSQHGRGVDFFLALRVECTFSKGSLPAWGLGILAQCGSTIAVLR